MRRWWLASLLLLVALGGCECSPDEVASPDRETREVSPTDVVPTSARALIEAERLDALLDILAAVAGQTAEDSLLRSSRERFRESLDFDLYASDDWQELGIDTASPVRLFEDGGHWVLHSAFTRDETLETWLKGPGAKFQVTREEVEGFDLYRFGEGPKDIAVLYLATDGDYAFTIPVGRAQPRWPSQLEPEPLTVEQVKKRISRWVELGSSERWSQATWAKRIDKELEDEPIVATIRSRTWMKPAREEDPSQASVIYRRIRNQLGPVGIGLRFDPVGRRVRAKLAMSSDPREPTFVQDLQGASGEVPPVGGLIDPGVLGAARISVEPRKFYTLMRSLLPAQLRSELDEVIAEFDSELAIDVVEDVLTNLNGHVIAVFYGFEPDILTGENPTLLADIFRLRATREALLVPIKSRERMEDVLNAATQLSKGKLNRQDTGSSIQYVWVDEGLQWAIILAKDHIILVDSTAAFDHAVAYERNARPLGEVMRKKGLDTLFSGRDKSGLYLDAQSLSNLMFESKNNDLAAWLRPFSTILLTAEGSDADIELVLDE